MEINNKNIGYYIYFLVTISLILIKIFYPWSEVEYNFQRSEAEQSIRFITNFGLLISALLAILFFGIFIMKCIDGDIQFSYKLEPFKRRVNDESIFDIKIKYYEKLLQDYIKQENIEGQKECIENIKQLKVLRNV